MRRDAAITSLILKQMDNSLVMLTFVRGSNEEKIAHAALLCVKHNVKIRIKKVDNPEKSLQIQKLPNFKVNYSSAKTLKLITGEEIIGIYKELQKDFDQINLILELADGKIVQISFPKGSVEAEMVCSTLSKVKHNVKLQIQKMNDEKKPLLVKTIPNLSTKEQSIYHDNHTVKRIAPYCDPSILNPRKRILKAISTMADIIENKQLIAAVIVGNKVQCNKMKKIGKTDLYYCFNLGGSVSTRFCLEKCAIGKEFLKIKGEM